MPPTTADVTVTQTGAYQWELTLASGTLNIEIPDDTVGVIWHLHVDPADRGRGIGTALLERALELLANHDISLDEVHAQIQTSDGATEHLFTTHGFDTRTYTTRDGDDIVDCVKHLD